MDFKKIDQDIIGKGQVENLKFKINKLEETSKSGFMEEFVQAITDYSNAYKQAIDYIHPEDLRDCDKKVREIFNFIPSRETDKF